MSHDLLDDLLDDVPRHVVPDAGRAWRAGAARRRRRYAAEGLAVAACVAAVGLGLVHLHDRAPVQPADPGQIVEGYPRAVPKPVTQQVLPDRPGPVAGGFEWVDDKQNFHWSVVSASGESWVMPADVDAGYFLPTVSDDGRWLGYLRDDGGNDGEFVLHDLATGEKTVLAEVGIDRGDSVDPYMVHPQTPSYWSPDDSQVLVKGFGPEESTQALLLSTDGEVTPLAVTGHPVGWLGPDRLVWLRAGGTVDVTDLTGAIVDSVTLRTDPPLGALDQWSGRLSPDDKRLAVLDDRGLTTFNLRTGERLRDMFSDAAELADHSPPVWQGDEVLVWTDAGLVDVYNAQTPVELASRWGTTGFADWSSDALAGDPQAGPGVTAWRYWPVLWWWQQAALGLVVLLVVGGTWWLRRRRRS